MFGYIIPAKCELKVKDYDRFRAAYCGLCHSLKRHYGPIARFVLNFDFTFLAILLSYDAETIPTDKKRCIAHPFRKRTCCNGGKPFRRAAGYSLILTRWRLRDAIADSGFLKSLFYRLLARFLGRAYRKATHDFPDFDTHCRTQLECLRILEAQNSGDLDRVADAFAQILPHAAEGVTNETERRIFAELLYHIGRWIYIIDAYDDLEQDKQTGNYNSLAARFNTTDGKLPDEDKDWLQTTLTHSANRTASAYNLLPSGLWSPILENIIYLSIPSVTESVFNGRFRRRLGRWERKETL
ncbi:MAG: DUF5685 family protein [Oscillospiraceae bacterium]|nr:DUF5685 family protein [Oscillospiraceae bacterium]